MEDGEYYYKLNTTYGMTISEIVKSENNKPYTTRPLTCSAVTGKIYRYRMKHDIPPRRSPIGLKFGEKYDA